MLITRLSPPVVFSLRFDDITQGEAFYIDPDQGAHASEHTETVVGAPVAVKGGPEALDGAPFIKTHELGGTDRCHAVSLLTGRTYMFGPDLRVALADVRVETSL